MKKLFFTLILLVSLSVSAQVNLVQNGGFEGDDALTNQADPVLTDDGVWRNRVPANRVSNVSTAFVTDEKYAGERSLKIGLVANNYRWYYNYVYQKVTVDREKKYKLTFWAKGNDRIQVVLYTNTTGTSFAAITGNPVATPALTADWVKYSLTLDIPAYVPSDITSEMVANQTILALGSNSVNAGVSVWIDDVELVDEAASNLPDVREKETLIYVKDKKVYFSDNELSRITVFDMAGQLVLSKDVPPGGSIAINQSGCYILKVKTRLADFSKKMVIH